MLKKQSGFSRSKPAGERKKPRSSSKNSSSKGDSSRRNSFRGDSTRRDSSRTSSSRRDSNGWDKEKFSKDSDQDKPRRDSSRRDSSRRNSSWRDSPRKDSDQDKPRRDSSRRDSPRRDSSLGDSSRRDSSRRDSSRTSSSRRDSNRWNKEKFSKDSDQDKPRRDSTRRNSFRKDSSWRDSPRKDSDQDKPRRDSTRRDSFRKDSDQDKPRRDSSRRDSSRRDSTRRNSFRKDSSWRDSPRKDSDQDKPRKDSSRRDSNGWDKEKFSKDSDQDKPRKDSSRRDSSRRDSSRRDSTRRNSFRKDSSWRDSTRKDSDQDKPRKDSSRRDSSRRNSFRRDSTRKDSSRRDSNRWDKEKFSKDSDQDKPRRDSTRRDSSWRDSSREKRGTPKILRNLSGVIKRHPDGFGFFIPEDNSHQDVYLPVGQMEGLMNNDKIEIAVLASKHRKGLFSGKVLHLIKRAQNRIIGQYLPQSKEIGLIKDNNGQWGEDFKIRLKPSQKIKKGEWVQAQVLHWPGSPKGFYGEIQGSLGVFPHALEDNIRVVQKYGLPFSFPEEVLKEVEEIPEILYKEDLKDRKDLRSLNFVTVDGKTAQDFDDAILIKNLEEGFVLYVAIADVSHYVQKNSALDKQAYQRGNSTYFPGFTLPMLPEKLSNNLCSLKQNKDRLAFVAEIHFDSEAKKKKALFYPAVIQNQARLTYGETQEIIEQAASKRPKAIIENILSAEKLARKLLEARSKKHFINLEIPETEIILNTRGEPLDITQSRRVFAHQLIEECMLATNQAVAEHLKKRKVPSLYRTHDLPKSESLKFLELFIQSLGLKLELQEPDLHKKISSLLEKFNQPPLSDVVQILILRALSQAVYSSQNKLHFGLNLEHYTHFTSPIRRYSDLLVHRVLKAVLVQQVPPYKEDELTSMATNISASEQRSVKAERHIKDIKKARFLKKHLGEEMEGVISSCTRFGFFVKLKLYAVEGLVPINQLKGKWYFEESLSELKSKSSGKRFKIGDSVLIQVISSNIDTGQINFDLKNQLLPEKKIKTEPQTAD